MRTVPSSIDTSCNALNKAWAQYAGNLLDGPDCIVVADDDLSLNWDAFLGRSVPLQPMHLAGAAPDFSQLRERGLDLCDLAALWQIEPLREHFMHRPETRSEPASASCSLLLKSGGQAGELLCDAFESLPPSSSHWSVRALLQNASLLADTDYSFRKWLERESQILGETEFPPRDFRRTVVVTEPSGVAQRSLEQALAMLMGRIFHRAGANVAAHILSDWQLGLWLNEQAAVFDLFPHDSHHKRFVAHCGDLPEGEADFIAWWHGQPGCAELPPRLASACMACDVAEKSK